MLFAAAAMDEVTEMDLNAGIEWWNGSSPDASDSRIFPGIQIEQAAGVPNYSLSSPRSEQ